MFFEILILISLISLAALYAGSEIVFIVVSKLKVELKAQQEIYTAKIALQYLNNPEEFLITSLVGTNIFQIAFSSTFALIVNSLFAIDPLYVMLMTASLLLIFSEIIPKVFFREDPEKFVYPFTIFLILSKIILYPIIFVINFIINKIIKILKVDNSAEKLSYTREDFYNLIKFQSKSEPEFNEFSYILKYMELMDKIIKEVMIPRTEIIALEKNAKLDNIFDLFSNNNESKIMIYENNIDNIIGYVEIKDLIEEPIIIEKIIKPVLYVPETIKCSEILLKFQQEKKYISVVVDEFGGTAGLVTYQMLLEEIIGSSQIQPESGDLLNKKLDDNTYLFSGRIELDILRDRYNLDVHSQEAITLAGFITEKSGKVPKIGEIVDIGKYRFRIIKSNKTRIELVELKLKE